MAILLFNRERLLFKVVMNDCNASNAKTVDAINVSESFVFIVCFFLAIKIAIKKNIIQRGEFKLS